MPPPTCLSNHILAATNDRHLWAIHGGHRNIGALYLGFLYGFLHFLSEENQEKTAAVAGWEAKFDSVCFISPVLSWWQKYNFSGVWIKSVFSGGESENIQELWIWSLVQRAKVLTPACSGAKSAAIVPTWPLNLENHKPGSLKKKNRTPEKELCSENLSDKFLHILHHFIVFSYFHITFLCLPVFLLENLDDFFYLSNTSTFLDWSPSATHLCFAFLRNKTSPLSNQANGIFQRQDLGSLRDTWILWKIRGKSLCNLVEWP